MVLHDDRFSSFFENSDFKVDTESDAYKMLVKRIDAEKRKKNKEASKVSHVEDMEVEVGFLFVNDASFGLSFAGATAKWTFHDRRHP